MAKQWLRDFFMYTWKEASGVLLLVVIALLIRTAPDLFPQDEMLRFTEWDEFVIDSFSNSYKNRPASHTGMHLFAFDPNTVSPDSLKLLGLRAYLVQRLVKYRSAGYTFRQPEDLMKVYGMDSGWYRQVKPWVRIRSATAKYRADTGIRKQQTEGRKAGTRQEFFQPVDVAVADSAELRAIRGIGPVLASRIVKYRQLLGGFHSLSQLMEVYGLDEVKFREISPMITLHALPLVKLDIREADALTLARHPYLNMREAKAIVAYRNAHPGEEINAATIQKILALEATTIEKIRPYLPGDQGL